MKRIAAVALCMILVVFFSTVLAVSGFNAQTPSIKVMSYNIRMALATDDPVPWEGRKDKVLALIKDENPDIVNMQEVTGRQYHYLREKLGDEYGWYGLYRTLTIPHDSPTYELFAAFDEASPIFYKKSRFELVAQECFWLSETPDVVSRGWDADANRICTHVTLLDKITKKTVEVYNTHFDHMGETARLESAKLISGKISNHSGPAIATGDFNFNEGEEGYPIMAEAMKDAKFVAKDSDTGASFQKFTAGSMTGKPIDFVFVTDHFNVEKYKLNRGFYGGEYPPSDHFALSVVLNYKE